VWWLFGALAGLGALTGLRLRAPALLASTAIVIVVALIAAVARHRSVLETVGTVVMAAVTFQAAYLGGLALATWWRRSRTTDTRR
jgi:hypothetical protein